MDLTSWENMKAETNIARCKFCRRSVGILYINRFTGDIEHVGPCEKRGTYETNSATEEAIENLRHNGHLLIIRTEGY